MVKSLVGALVVAVLLTVGAIYEGGAVRKEFAEFKEEVEEVYYLVDENTATEDDMYNLQEKWLSKKRRLFVFIPHNEIKEIELWLTESIKLVRDEKWEDALSKIEVLRELVEEIPKSFELTFENIL